MSAPTCESAAAEAQHTHQPDATSKGDIMEFIVEFELNVPGGTPESEVNDHQSAEASAAARLADEGRLLRLWRLSTAADDRKFLGLYSADSETELDGLLRGLPLADWMRVTVTRLAPHPNDPAPASAAGSGAPSRPFPHPRLSKVFRLEATLAPPIDLGDIAGGHRRIVPLTGGTFHGPDINGELLPGASADWQIILPDGTALGDIRYTLQTDDGDLLYVQSRSVRHGSTEVLARLARGDEVDASEYTFRTSTRIETAAPALEWLNKGVFIGVAGRQATGVIYETYLVG
jgi:muconolactone delta-isomerase